MSANTLLTSDDRALLAAVLNELLPAHADVPAAGDLGLADDFDALLLDGAWRGRVVQLLHAIDAAAGTQGFLARGDDGRIAALQAVESTHRAGFGVLIELAYRLYYSHPRVIKRLEGTHGYPARPPQPLGYDMEPWDDRLVEKQRQRAPFWRPV